MKLVSRSFDHAAAVLHDPETASDIATLHPTGNCAATQERAARLAACWNACHGLDLPDDIPAGAVANLVTAARAGLYEMRHCGGAIGESLEAKHLDAALAPFTGNVTDDLPCEPESPEIWGIRARCTGSLKAVFDTADAAGTALAGIKNQRDHYVVSPVSPYEIDPMPEGVVDRRKPPIEIPEDRRTVWSFEVDGQHVRWCGTLDQWHKDRLAYVDKSEGTWEARGPHLWRFIKPSVNGAKPRRSVFRAVKQITR